MLPHLFRKLHPNHTKTLLSRSLHYFSDVPKYDPTKDYYKILNVSKTSSQSQIKKSYYKLAKQYHPDSNPGKQSQFKQINQAYGVLSDQKVKKQYNASRSFRGFSRKMRNKASQGEYQYQEYRTMYDNMSAEEQEEILEGARRKVRNILIGGLVLLVLAPFLTRRNHRFFVMDGDQLVGVEFQGGMGGGMMPPPGFATPMGGAPYPNQQQMYGGPQQQPAYGGPQPGYGGQYGAPQGYMGPQGGQGYQQNYNPAQNFGYTQPYGSYAPKQFRPPQ